MDNDAPRHARKRGPLVVPGHHGWVAFRATRTATTDLVGCAITLRSIPVTDERRSLLVRSHRGDEFVLRRLTLEQDSRREGPDGKTAPTHVGVLGTTGCSGPGRGEPRASGPGVLRGPDRVELDRVGGTVYRQPNFTFSVWGGCVPEFFQDGISRRKIYTTPNPRDAGDSRYGFRKDTLRRYHADGSPR